VCGHPRTRGYEAAGSDGLPRHSAVESRLHEH
jgi:hypothetical protein